MFTQQASALKIADRERGGVRKTNNGYAQPVFMFSYWEGMIRTIFTLEEAFNAKANEESIKRAQFLHDYTQACPQIWFDGSATHPSHFLK